MIEDIQEMHPGISRDEAVETIVEAADDFLSNHVMHEHREIFIECFDSFSVGSQERLLGQLVRHGTPLGRRHFYERHVQPKRTLAERVELNEVPRLLTWDEVAVEQKETDF